MRNYKILPSHYRIKSRDDGTRAEGDRLGEHIAYSPDPPPRALQDDLSIMVFQRENYY